MGKFKIPKLIRDKGLSEQDVLDIIESVASRLWSKFKFGYHDECDMKQEARMAALGKLAKYDGSFPLENYLYVCVHNELFNLKRNKFERPDKPCYTCPFYDKHNMESHNQCTGFADKIECNLYRNWYKRNNAKRNIMEPTDIENIQDVNEDNMRLLDTTTDIERKELLAIIDKNLDIKHRKDYLKLLHGIKLPRVRRIMIEEVLQELLKEHYSNE